MKLLTFQVLKFPQLPSNQKMWYCHPEQPALWRTHHSWIHTHINLCRVHNVDLITVQITCSPSVHNREVTRCMPYNYMHDNSTHSVYRSNKVCSSQEFQGLSIPHVQAWERLGNEHLCLSLYASWVFEHFQEVYKLGHKCSFPKRSQACTWGMHMP